jgi:hypothetical protein
MREVGLHRYQTGHPMEFTVRIWSIRTGNLGHHGQQHKAEEETDVTMPEIPTEEPAHESLLKDKHKPDGTFDKLKVS